MNTKKIQRAWGRFHRKHLENRKLRFITWFDKQFPGKYCWADCVSWAFDPMAFNPFKIDNAKACKLESETHWIKSCYCGAWNEGKCWDLLTEAERNAITENEKKAKDLNDELPF